MITAMPRIAIAVRDFPAAVSTFRDRLGMPVLDVSEGSVESLGARLAMCVPEGGSNIEIMSPANPAAPLSQSLQRFLDRRGEGLFALMLEAPDPNAEAKELSERGLDVLPLMAGAAGRDIHPRSTHGVLIRVYPVDSFQGRAEPAGAPDDDPGLSGIARVLIAVRDLDHAVSVYRSGFGLEVDPPSLDASRGVRRALCHPPSGGAIELLAGVDRTRPFGRSVAEFVEGDREGMYALVVQSRDPGASAGRLASRGLDVGRAEGAEHLLELDRSATYGARLWIEAV